LYVRLPTIDAKRSSATRNVRRAAAHIIMSEEKHANQDQEHMALVTPDPPIQHNIPQSDASSSPVSAASAAVHQAAAPAAAAQGQ